MQVHHVRIYYEDTDFSGSVYHANYLRYMERGREHLIGCDELRRLWDEDGVGFVVYKAELTYKEPARFGDALEVRTTAERTSDWRAVFRQDVWRAGGSQPLVEGRIELVTVDKAGKLVRLPEGVRTAIDAQVASRTG
ncbi:MAG: YbgC/FadM family acyl-CoA thioesterase [Alphaproteobacteria bacterium]|nr:YbgC/FadM family acyl-CoA thioesterase [Alphaproteobacteria bacterium]